jgi:hypothetical protein
MDGAIDDPTHGGHPRRRTWPHSLPFPRRRVRAEEEERGKRKEGKEGDVASDGRGPQVGDPGESPSWLAA